MGYLQDELKKAVGKKWFIVILIFTVIITVYLLFSAIFSFFPFSSIKGVVQDVSSSESIISNYEYFYDMKYQIDATRNKYIIAKKANLPEANGILMVLESMIGEYNSRSRQITRKLWKSNDLPYQINSEIGVER